MDVETAAARLEALGNPSRLEIYRILVRVGPSGLPVGEVQRRTGMARSTLSHHLHRLIAVDLVQQRRAATTLHCSTNYTAMTQTISFLTEECCVGASTPETRPVREVEHD